MPFDLPGTPREQTRLMSRLARGETIRFHKDGKHYLAIPYKPDVSAKKPEPPRLLRCLCAIFYGQRDKRVTTD